MLAFFMSGDDTGGKGAGSAFGTTTKGGKFAVKLLSTSNM
jgi:hypothetical protein